MQAPRIARPAAPVPARTSPQTYGARPLRTPAPEVAPRAARSPVASMGNPGPPGIVAERPAGHDFGAVGVYAASRSPAPAATGPIQRAKPKLKVKEEGGVVNYEDPADRTWKPVPKDAQGNFNLAVKKATPVQVRQEIFKQLGLGHTAEHVTLNEAQRLQRIQDKGGTAGSWWSSDQALLQAAVLARTAYTNLPGGKDKKKNNENKRHGLGSKFSLPALAGVQTDPHWGHGVVQPGADGSHATNEVFNDRDATVPVDNPVFAQAPIDNTALAVFQDPEGVKGGFGMIRTLYPYARAGVTSKGLGPKDISDFLNPQVLPDPTGGEKAGPSLSPRTSDDRSDDGEDDRALATGIRASLRVHPGSGSDVEEHKEERKEERDASDSSGDEGGFYMAPNRFALPSHGGRGKSGGGRGGAMARARVQREGSDSDDDVQEAMARSLADLGPQPSGMGASSISMSSARTNRNRKKKAKKKAKEAKEKAMASSSDDESS
jgi:hypothetical protein